MTMNPNISQHKNPTSRLGPPPIPLTFSNHPNLLERDLDGSNYAVNHIVCDDHSIPLLNIGDVLSNIGAIFRSIYRLSKNKCVYLRLAKYLFPRESFQEIYLKCNNELCSLLCFLVINQSFALE